LTLKIMLAVVGLLLPVLLVYHAHLHRVFRGKTKGGRLQPGGMNGAK
jgi:cytochrome bd-type quinol oxidase subunit 2